MPAASTRAWRCCYITHSRPNLPAVGQRCERFYALPMHSPYLQVGDVPAAARDIETPAARVYVRTGWGGGVGDHHTDGVAAGGVASSVSSSLSLPPKLSRTARSHPHGSSRLVLQLLHWAPLVAS